MRYGLQKIIAKTLSSLNLTEFFQTSRNFVIVYHHVGNEIGVSEKQFKETVEYLKESFEPVKSSKAFDKQRGGFFAVTFDDGYRNFYEQAAPILKELKVPATVFVIPSFLEKEGREFYQEGLKAEIMDKDEVKEISEKDNFEIGNHTLTHKDLTTTTEYEKEIKQSKEKLESILDKEVKEFCYPWGKYTEEAREKAAQYHRYCYALKSRQIHEDDSRFEIPRIDGQQKLYMIKWQTTSIYQAIRKVEERFK
jgi:peptidoglycan/xylan/chitin deacetylase (PgdA/CDA1 family)